MERLPSKISSLFNQIAVLLDIKGENVFKVRAYQKAARIIEEYTGDLEVLARKGQLTSLEGIGKDLAAKIEEIIQTGSLEYFEALKKTVPSGVVDLISIPSIGPKKAKLFYEKLGIDSLSALENAIERGDLLKIEGIKDKTIENIKKGITLLRSGRDSFSYLEARSYAERLILKLKKDASQCEIAGSLRRKKPFVRDIDILVSAKNPELLMKLFVGMSEVQQVLAHGPTKSSVLLKENIQADIRLVEEDSFGAALLYFTGSKDFNIKLRGLAQDTGYKINEYGVYKGETMIAGTTEKEIFKKLGLSYIPPELRENRGEVEAAVQQKDFKLLDRSRIRGEFHVHSRYSDGEEDITTMAESARQMGYEYIGISDHSVSLKVARGLSDERLKAKIAEIRGLKAKIKGIHVLCGQEIDILDDGSLDCPESLLKELDVVIAAIHIGLKQSQAKITRRLVSACKNKYVHIIAHPTGVLRGVRNAYDVDLSEVYKAARDHAVALEINCYPDRLDLDELNARSAAQAGVRLILGSDSHEKEDLRNMELGVNVARRAWLTNKDIINTMTYKEVVAWLKAKR